MDRSSRLEEFYAECLGCFPERLVFCRPRKAAALCQIQIRRVAGAALGKPGLVENGKPSPTIERFASIRHPRTALGLRKDGTLVILVADGRRERALGFTGPEMSEIFIRDGVENAINLDGGGSTTLYIHAEAVSYTHLRAHETVLDLVCRLLLEKKTHS